MTLHWWMHWFWVTAVLALMAGRLTDSAPRPQATQSVTLTEVEERAERQGRAMYFMKTSTNAPPTGGSANGTDQSEIAHPAIQVTLPPSNSTSAKDVSDATPEPTTPPAETAAPNTTTYKRRNLTKQEASIVDGVAESRIVTEKPLSLETTLLHTRTPHVESSRGPVSDDDGVNVAAVTGVVFGVVVLMSLAGSTAFVLYRRRYLNKPQTLNDKCSNPDSSGYLDDSTIRDNSEEMYSLDNDSFLNSLEVMTFQNYWTDVKHTKL